MTPHQNVQLSHDCGANLTAVFPAKNFHPVNASERCEERLGDNLLDEMSRLQRKAWELLSKTESEGDHQGSIVALRKVRECLESLGDMLAKSDMLVKVDAANAEPHQITIKFADASICPVAAANGMK